MNTEKYIQACLDGALRDIENAPQGMANETLNKNDVVNQNHTTQLSRFL